MVVGGVQILVSLPTVTGGTVFGVVPNWLKNLASLNGKFFGLPIPPVILIWILVSILLIVGLRHTKWGRNMLLVVKDYQLIVYLSLKGLIGLECM